MPAELESIAELMESIGRAIKPRVVQIPQLTDTQLSSLTMPILAIMGGKDALIDSHDTRTRLEKLAPQAEVCFLENGYHFLPNQASRIGEFLDRLF